MKMQIALNKRLHIGLLPLILLVLDGNRLCDCDGTVHLRHRRH